MAQGQDGRSGAGDQEHRHGRGAVAAAGEDSLLGPCGRRDQGGDRRLQEKAGRQEGDGTAGGAADGVSSPGLKTRAHVSRDWMIEITDVAAKKIQSLMAKQGISDGGLRVGVKGGGCLGLSYTFAWEKEA